MSNVELHIFAGNDLNGSPIWTATDEDPGLIEKVSIRPALNQLGGGQVVLSKQETGGLLTRNIIAPENFCRVLVPRISTTRYAWGFFLTDISRVVLSTDEGAGKDVTFGGPGPLFYLERAILWDQQFYGEGYKIDEDNGVFRWDAGTPAGRVLFRLFMENASNTIADFLPDLTRTFDGSTDSDGNAWSESFTEEFELAIGGDYLSHLWQLQDSVESLDVWMDLGTVAAPKMELNAYEAPLGRDLSGSAFGAGVVLFKEGVNIATELVSRRRARKKVSHVLAMGDDATYATAARLGYDPGEYARAIGLSFPGISDDTDLQRKARRWIAHQDAGENEIVLELSALGDDEATGRYFPGEEGATACHFWPGDTITVKTGAEVSPSELDYHYEDQRVMAITMELDEAADDTDADTQALSWRVYPELNVERDSWSAPRDGSGTSGSRKCRCLRLCAPTVAAIPLDDPDELLYSPSGSGATDPAPWLIDGDDTTYTAAARLRGSGAVFYATWNSAVEITGYTMKQGFHPTDPQYGITSFVRSGWRVYYSDDDPASFNSETGTWVEAQNAEAYAAVQDSTHDLGSPGAHKRWKWVSTVSDGGGMLQIDWVVRELELEGGTAEENPYNGTSNRAARCDHTHPNEDIAEHVDDPTDAHDASAISIADAADNLTASDVEGALAELATGQGDHITDTADAHDASAISIADAGTLYTGTDVEAALQEIGAHPGDTSDAHDASAISVADAGGYFTGTDVEAALQELGAGGGGAGALDDLTDVTITTPADGQVLTYDSGTGEWVNENSASGFSNPMTTAGDIIKGGTAGVAERLAIGTNGHVLTVVSGAPAWAAASGGSGPTINDGPWWAPWCAPASPDAADSEFDGNDLSGWTRVYNSGAPKGTWTEEFGSANFILTTTGGSSELDVYAKARTMSVGDYVEIAYRHHTSQGASYLGAFVGFADGTTFNNSGSHVVGAFLHHNGVAYRHMLNIWDGYNTRTTDGTIVDRGTVGTYFAARVKYEAANTWGLYISSDGSQWRTIQTNYAKTMTPTHVLLGVSMLSSPNAGRGVDIQYFRVNS